MAEVRAQLNGLRIAPRKVRAVTNLVKGKDVIYALGQLEFLMRKPALPIIKLLNSAVSNAENTFNMVKENLYIKSFTVDEGIKLKRYRPKAQGRAGEIQKKTSRLKLVLDERVAGLKRQPSDKKKKEQSKIEVEKTENKKHDHEIKTELGSKSKISNLGKRLFRRKAI